jgi:hypothetical protein
MRTPTQKPPQQPGDTGALADLIRIFAGSALREFEKQLDEDAAAAKPKAKHGNCAKMEGAEA